MAKQGLRKQLKRKVKLQRYNSRDVRLNHWKYSTYKQAKSEVMQVIKENDNQQWEEAVIDHRYDWYFADMKWSKQNRKNVIKNGSFTNKCI